MTWSSEPGAVYRSDVKPDDYPVQLIPLGGLGEIGMNAMLVGCQGRWVLVDFGAMFPERVDYGVDLFLPNLQTLRLFAPAVEALILTHGHEDHIGGVPYLLKEWPLPVYGTPFTLRLVEAKVRDAGLPSSSFNGIPLEPGSRMALANMVIRAFGVTHSIPQALGLLFETPVGGIYYSGDFRLDRAPLDGVHFGETQIRALLDEPPSLMLSDSTNAELTGRTRSEETVAAEFDEILRDHPQRVFVSLFSSNIHRMQRILELSEHHGRHVVLSGRRIVENVQLAEQLGFVRYDLRRRIGIEHADTFEGPLTVLVTGSQGETNSDLYRMSHRRHRHLTVKPTDVVVFSSREIPGNEKSISRLMNQLARMGARVISERQRPVHTSGHARREELADLMRWVNPRSFIPIHGEYRFLQEHARLAEELGITQRLVIENGDVVGVDRHDPPQRIGLVDATPMVVFGKLVGDREMARVDERMALSYCGVICAHVKVQQNRAGIDVITRLYAQGFLSSEHPLLRNAEQYVNEEVVISDSPLEEDELQSVVRLAVRRFFNRMIGKKPNVIPIVELGQ